MEEIEFAMKAVEKQIPMESKFETVHNVLLGELGGFVCGGCGASLRYRIEYKEPIDNYCWDCGQKIKWKGVE